MFQKLNFHDSIELWGEQIQRARRGLDEEQVRALIGRLISEREILLERDKQFKALAAQAEKITLEADMLAAEIRLRAEESARVQAKLILDRAREEGEQLLARKSCEGEARARQKAEAIITQAFDYFRKCISEAEAEAAQRAREIILQAFAESNRIIERKRVEAEDIARREVEHIKALMLADAWKKLEAAGAEAESLAQAQAQAILSSNRLEPGGQETTPSAL